MQLIVKAMMIIFAIIHLLPLPGLLGGAQFERLYGLSISDPNLIIMMRHRALLFAFLAVFVVYAAFREDLVWIGIAAGFISAASFVWLAWSVGGYNSSTARVVTADFVAMLCLIIAAICQLLSVRQ